MTDTTLPPEVETAISRIGIYVDGKLLGDNLDIIRDHLHRLAEENARLRESAQQIERECLEAWKQATHSRSCAKVAESELADVRRKWADAESKLAACDDDLRLVLAERDALKARIAEAPVGTPIELDGRLATFRFLKPYATNGKRVALLPLDDEAKS